MKLGKSKIFLLFCLSFVIGVFFGKYLNYYIMAGAAMVFILLATVFWTNKKILLAGLLGLTLLLGSLRYQTSFSYHDPNFIGQLYNQKVELVGTVVRDPDVREDKTNLTIRVPKYSGDILITPGKYPEYQYGDQLKFSGKLEAPFETADFSYKNYLSRYEIYATMRFPKIEKLGSGQGNRIVATLLWVKHQFQQVLSQLLPEPHNAFMLGLILGLKKSLPENLKQSLALAGVTHIVVISGYNISVITRNILKTRVLWGRRIAFWLSLITILAFVIMTGAEASVVRAAVMGMLVVLALNVGRLYLPLNALIFAAAVMVAQNPKILSFDVGFQLSFMATVGLMILSPIWEKWLARLPDILGLRTNLASTLSAQVFTLPLLIYYFDRLSLIAPVVNVLILWVIPYTMFFGFCLALIGFISLPMAHFFVGIPWLFLEYMIRLIDFFARIPLAAVSVQINLWAIILYYVLLALGIGFYRYRQEFFYYLEYAKTQT